MRTFLEALSTMSAASTQNQALNAIVFFYRDVMRSPLGDLGKWARAHRPKKLPTWLTHGEMLRVLGGMPPFTRLMAEFAYGSGLRLAELLALRVKDVDFESCLVIVRRHHVHEHTLGKALRTAAKKVGIHKRVTAHTLRHSFATNLLAGGASITQVQELLGHTSVETTQVYLHCIPQFAASIVSPLDVVPSNIVPMHSPAAAPQFQISHA